MIRFRIDRERAQTVLSRVGRDPNLRELVWVLSKLTWESGRYIPPLQAQAKFRTMPVAEFMQISQALRDALQGWDGRPFIVEIRE
jgi:hypothetical protein